jgi:hypothetical protein
MARPEEARSLDGEGPEDAQLIQAVHACYTQTPAFDPVAPGRVHAVLAARAVQPWVSMKWLAVAAGLVVAIGISIGWFGARAGGTHATGAEVVSFSFEAPSAMRVVLVGDFNAWDPEATPLVRGPRGTWEVSVPLVPGRHVYAFVVDGSRWAIDPLAPRGDDDFGQPSAVKLVRSPS